MDYEYLRYKDSDGQLISLPILPIRLSCNRKKQDVWALIDSGADISVFNYSIAHILDIDVEKGRLLDLRGLVGGDVTSYVHQVNVTVQGLASIDIPVAFTMSDTPDMAILGQKGFFDNFQIRFQRYKNLIEIYPKSTTA